VGKNRDGGKKYRGKNYNLKKVEKIYSGKKQK